MSKRSELLRLVAEAYGAPRNEDLIPGGIDPGTWRSIKISNIATEIEELFNGTWELKQRIRESLEGVEADSDGIVRGRPVQIPKMKEEG